MLGHSDQCWHDELLYFEYHAILNVLQVALQENLAVLLLKHVGIGKLLDDDEDRDLGLLFDFFHFLMLTLRRYAVHDHLDDFEDKILRLLFRNILLGKIQQCLDALHLNRLLAKHKHSRRQRKDVDGDDVYDLRLRNEDLGLEQLLKQLLKVLEQLQLQVVLLARVNLHAGQHVLDSLIKSHDLENVFEI